MDAAEAESCEVVVSFSLLLTACSIHKCGGNAAGSHMLLESVQVDGVSLRVKSAGLVGRRPGQPIVVLESGGGAPLETWDPIFSAVATFAPAIAYDRAGTGQSTWDGQAPTPQRAGTRLERLLQNLGAEPPYVLVGHSWGGALARYFAGERPFMVAGILYLDPTDITLTTNDLVAVFVSFGAGAAEYDAFDRSMRQAMLSAPEALRAESEVILALLESDPAHRAIPPAPDVPTSVIVAGRVAAPPRDLLPFDTKAYAAAMQAAQARRLRAWVSGGGIFEVAADAGHMIHAEAPDLVIREIRRLVELHR